MVHTNFNIYICMIIAVHREPTRLRRGVNDSRMSMEVAVTLDAAKAESARRFQHLAVAMVEWRGRPLDR